jgi:hypothetical protein
VSAVPSGPVDLCTAKPNVETLGYYHASLRDENEILATLDGFVPGAEAQNKEKSPVTVEVPEEASLLLGDEVEHRVLRPA